MTTEIKTKICKDCKVEKPVADYYKRAKYTCRHVCKVCDGKMRKKYANNTAYVHKGKKKSKFELMPPEKREEILYDIRNITLKEVALKHNIIYGTLTRWIRDGVIPDR